MSDNRSSSGVRSLMAKFEGNNGTTSPPSRGRSPTGSDNTLSNGPRPLSKVRTSFVAVERSGQMAPQLGLKKISSTGDGGLGGDGGNDLKVALDDNKVNGGPVESSNGSGSIDKTSTAMPDSEVEKEEGSNKSQDPSSAPLFEEAAPAEQTLGRKEDQDLLSTEQQTATTLASDPQDEKIKTDDAAPSQDAENLGSLLKGSAFESPPAEEQHSAQAESPQKPKCVKSPSKVMGGKTPTYGRAAEAKHPSKTAEPKSKSLNSRPSAISTSHDATATKVSSKPSPVTTAAKSPTTPQTPKTPVTPKRQPLSKTSSPRQPLTPKEIGKPPAKKPSRASLASTKSTAQPTKPRQPPPPVSANNVAKKAMKGSPDSKTRPKSPTRPVRLPASATAPTASSAAKLGGAAPARSPNRASTTNLGRKPSTLKKDHKPSAPRNIGPTASNLHRKPSRPSLPVQNGHERPKSRVSNAGSKAPDEGFLARMMRPTASSASKTHEKVEPKTPPKKTAASKAKRRSDGSEDNEGHKQVVHKQGHQQNGLPDTAASTTQEDEAKQPEEEPVNQAAVLTNAIAT
ncbi:MAG: hypothetical protein M1830_004840 [Pleopsidium flavum]|nr:MAG: hypothetical protein M1830_004840 [Pleopsidium flavum]